MVNSSDLRSVNPASVPDSEVRSFFETYRTVAIVGAVLGTGNRILRRPKTRGASKRFRRGTIGAVGLWVPCCCWRRRCCC